IPSFESKSYESRPEDRTYATGPLEVLPGESLARYARRSEPQPETGGAEDRNAPLGAVAEEGHEVVAAGEQVEQNFPPVSARVSPEVTGGGVEPEAPKSNSGPTEVKAEKAGKAETPAEESDDSTEQNDQKSSPNARITDRSDNYHFAHRSSNRRGRRGSRGAPP